MNYVKGFIHTLTMCWLLTQVSVVSFAASDGERGATSTGEADVTLEIPENYQLSNVNDVTFGIYEGSGDLRMEGDLCVYHNGNGSYQVTISDNSKSSDGFTVEDGQQNKIPMHVSWNDEPGTMNNAQALYNQPLSDQTGANTLSTDCSQGGLSANMLVVLQEADLQFANVGSYQSTITVQVEPD